MSMIKVFLCYVFVIGFILMSCQDNEDEAVVFEGYVHDLDTDEPVGGAYVQVHLFDGLDLTVGDDQLRLAPIKELTLSGTANDNGFYSIRVPKASVRKQYDLHVKKESYVSYDYSDMGFERGYYNPIFIKEVQYGANKNQIKIGKAAYLKVTVINESQQEGKIVNFVRLRYNIDTTVGNSEIIVTEEEANSSIITPFIFSKTQEVTVVYEIKNGDEVEEMLSDPINLVKGDTVEYSIQY